MDGRRWLQAFLCGRKDSLWDGAHDARLTGDVVDEIPGGKVDRADWSVAPDDPRTGARPRPNSSAPYRAFSFVVYAGRRWKSAPRFLAALPAPALKVPKMFAATFCGYV